MKNQNYSKRDYLLPKGCSDLIDVLKQQAKKTALLPVNAQPPMFPSDATMTRELVIPAHTTVLQLAALLRKTPMRIVLDLMDLGIDATIMAELDLDTVSAIARRYGYIVRTAA